MLLIWMKFCICLMAKKLNFREGETILQAAVRAGIPLAHICGGNGRCSTCRVIILDGLEHCSPRNPKEQAIAELLQFAPEVHSLAKLSLMPE